MLTQLTHNNATRRGRGHGAAVRAAAPVAALDAVLPPIIFDRRKLLIATQAAMGVLALALGLLTVTGLVQLWHVYVFAFLLGCVAAFDAPARQTFVSELVGEADLSNAVALNSTSFNAARMIGPAIAGILIAAVGTGWVFLINAASFGAVLCSLAFLRVAELHPSRRALRAPGELRRGLPLCLEAARPAGDPSHAVPDRHVRAQFPDLHLDHGGQRLSRRRGPIRAADVDHGDRDGRPARCSPPAGEAPHRAAARRRRDLRRRLRAGRGHARPTGSSASCSSSSACRR